MIMLYRHAVRACMQGQDDEWHTAFSLKDVFGDRVGGMPHTYCYTKQNAVHFIKGINQDCKSVRDVLLHALPDSAVAPLFI